jgi:hypothetical protein
MILTIQVIKDIGIKSLVEVGLFTLGTNVMKGVLIACKSTVPLKKSKHKS